MDEDLTWRLRTEVAIDNLEVRSFPNTVSTKKALISRSYPFLEANPAGKAYRNDVDGMCAKQGNARCEDGP